MDQAEKPLAGPGGPGHTLLRRRRAVLVLAAAAAGVMSVLVIWLTLWQGPIQVIPLVALHEGQELHRQGKYQEAAEEFTRVINSSGPFPEAYLFRGIALHNAERFGDAVRDFSTALELDPENVVVRLYRGESYLALEQPDAAEADFVAVIWADPKDKRLIAAANAKLQALRR